MLSVWSYNVNSWGRRISNQSIKIVFLQSFPIHWNMSIGIRALEKRNHIMMDRLLKVLSLVHATCFSKSFRGYSWWCFIHSCVLLNVSQKFEVFWTSGSVHMITKVQAASMCSLWSWNGRRFKRIRLRAVLDSVEPQLASLRLALLCDF